MLWCIHAEIMQRREENILCSLGWFSHEVWLEWLVGKQHQLILVRMASPVLFLLLQQPSGWLLQLHEWYQWKQSRVAKQSCRSSRLHQFHLVVEVWYLRGFCYCYRLLGRRLLRKLRRSDSLHWWNSFLLRFNGFVDEQYHAWHRSLLQDWLLLASWVVLHSKLWRGTLRKTHWLGCLQWMSRRV